MSTSTHAPSATVPPHQPPVAMLRSAVLLMAVGAGGMAAVLRGIHAATGDPVHVLAVAGTGAKCLAIYVPLTFVVEEVALRGALDAHPPIGVSPSLAWRRSRNLAGPAFAHAAIDAVRNGLLLGL
ncbi:MAG: hypothetical protein WB441_04045 [Nocardioidaceae bacterium]